MRGQISLKDHERIKFDSVLVSFVVYCLVLCRTSLARLTDAEYTQAVRQRVGNYANWWYSVEAAEKLAGEP